MKLLLKNRSLMIIGIAESVSGIGSWITTMAIFAMIVFQGGGGVLQSSGIWLAGLAPMLVFSPLAGVLCDRFNRKWLMVASELLSGAAVTGLIFAGDLVTMYILLAVQASVASIMSPARQSSVPDLVSRDELTRANAFLQQLAGIIKICAPFLGGLILGVLAPQHAMVLDVISYVLSAALLTLLPALMPHRGAATEIAPGVTEMAAPSMSVWGVMRASARLRLLFVSAFLLIITLMAFDVLVGLFTRDVLHGDTEFFGLMVGLVGLGTVAASTALLARKKQRDPWADILVSLMLMALLPGSLSMVGWLPEGFLPVGASMVACLVGGFGAGLIMVQTGTLLQILSPVALLGRMSGLFQSTLVGGQLLALFVTPALVPSVFGITTFFAIGASSIVLVAVIMWVTLRRTAGTEQVQPVEVEADSSMRLTA